MAVEPPALAHLGLEQGIWQQVLPRVKDVAIMVAQAAVRILFILSSIWVAATFLPISFHAVAIPLIAIGATAIASFFYEQLPALDAPERQALFPLIRGEGRAAPIPGVLPDVPPGLVNRGANCAFNSVLQALHSDPRSIQWLTHLLEDDQTIDAFVQFIEGYNISRDDTNRFRAFVAAQPAENHPLVRDLFVQFCQMGDAPVSMRRFCADDFARLERVKQTFNEVLTRYAQEVGRGARVEVGSAMRGAIHRLNESVSQSNMAQIDAGEILVTILGLFPPGDKLRMQATQRYDTTNLPPLLGYPDGVIDREELDSTLQLGVPPHIASSSIQALLNFYCNSEEVLSKASVERINEHGQEVARNVPYPVRTTRRLLFAPPVIWMEAKRFEQEYPSQSWLSKVLPSWFPPKPVRIRKRNLPIEAQAEVTIQLVDGQMKRYRLASFIVHSGDTPDSGHYVAYREVGGAKYKLDDSHVTLLSQAEWERRAQQGYLYCYVEVPDQ